MIFDTTTSEVLRVSDEHDKVKIVLTIRIEIRGREYGTTSIDSPTLFPFELYDELWQRGIAKGFHDAIFETDFSLATSGVDAVILALDISEDYQNFTSKELSVFGNALATMTFKVVIDMLGQMSVVEMPSISFDQAKELLAIHAYKRPAHPKVELGFLGSLMLHHIYIEKVEGFTLYKENFSEVMTALSILGPHLRDSATLDRDVISSLWNICKIGRDLIQPQEAWRRKNLMTSHQAEQLGDWIDAISHTVTTWLDGGDLNCILLMHLVSEKG